MKLNVYFDNASVYNFEKLDVIVGEKFKVEAVDAPEGIAWFFDNDPVVQAEAIGNQAIITAAQEGVTNVLFVVNNNTQVMHKFTINVVNPVNLNPIVLNVELK
jgi:hypothetical protein